MTGHDSDGARQARRILDAVADIGRSHTTAKGLECLLASQGATWVADMNARLAGELSEDERAQTGVELGAIAETLLGVGGGATVNGLLGRVLSLLVRIEADAEGGRAVMQRLLGAALAERAEREGRRILVVNPGSTSTKVALFTGIEKTEEFEVHLSPGAPDSAETRASAIAAWLSEVGTELAELDGISCRCGFVRPVPTGIYRVVPEMLKDLETPRIQHASNMAIFIGTRLAELSGRASEQLIVTRDPVVSDEVESVERLTGFLKIKRDGTGAHYLNHKAVWRLLASLCGLAPQGLAAVTAHVGGGVSIARHAEGQVSAIVDAFAGIPSANRAGTLDLPRLLSLLKNGDLTIKELERVVFSSGGLLSLAGTNDFRALTSFRTHGADPDQRRKIDLILDFYGRQIASSLLKLTADGRPTALLAITGGIARSDELVSRVEAALCGAYPLVRVPGALEHESLAAGLIRGFYEFESLTDYVEARDALKLRRRAEDRLLDTSIFQREVLYKKPDAPIVSLDEVIDAARISVKEGALPRIAIVGAENDEALLAAKRANEEGVFRIARFSLVGDFAEINELAYELDLVIDGDNYEVIDAEDAVEEAIALLDSGHAQLLMKGHLKTEVILRGVFRYLKRSGRIKPGDVVSHVLVADIPVRDKLLLVTDAAVNPYPDEDKRVAILENALRVAKSLNIQRPRAAVISAIESVNRSVESSVEAEGLAARFKDRPDCVVEGPLSFDVATDSDSAEEKHYEGVIRGDADILLMPDIDAGNILYKTLTTQSGATVAGVIVAGDMPIVLTSRGDSARSKLASISLVVKLWNDWQRSS